MDQIESPAATAEGSSAEIIADPALALAEMVRTRFPLWRPRSKSAPFRIQPLDAAKPRRLVSGSLVPWLLDLGLIAMTDDPAWHSGEIYILTAEGWRVGRAPKIGQAPAHGGN